MNVMSGALRPDSGSLELKGDGYEPANTLDARKNGIALIHQELSLAPHLSVAENVLMGIENSHFGWLDRKALDRRAADVLANFDHPDIKPEMPVSALSTAGKQVIEICRDIAARDGRVKRQNCACRWWKTGPARVAGPGLSQQKPEAGRAGAYAFDRGQHYDDAICILFAARLARFGEAAAAIRQARHFGRCPRADRDAAGAEFVRGKSAESGDRRHLPVFLLGRFRCGLGVFWNGLGRRKNGYE